MYTPLREMRTSDVQPYKPWTVIDSLDVPSNSRRTADEEPPVPPGRCGTLIRPGVASWFAKKSLYDAYSAGSGRVRLCLEEVLFVESSRSPRLVGAATPDGTVVCCGG